jgi:hypothetical protein
MKSLSQEVFSLIAILSMVITLFILLVSLNSWGAGKLVIWKSVCELVMGFSIAAALIFVFGLVFLAIRYFYLWAP